MLRTLLTVGALSLALTACGDGGSGGASSSEIAAVTDACNEQLNLGDAVCSCIADKSGELSDKERDFVIATLDEDDAKVARLRSSMAPDEAMRAAMFFVNAPAECAKQES